MARQLFTQEAGTMVTVPPAIGTHKMESTDFQCHIECIPLVEIYL